jgi:hypothetical protein
MAAGLARAAIKADAKVIIIRRQRLRATGQRTGEDSRYQQSHVCWKNKVCSTRKLRFYVKYSPATKLTTSLQSRRLGPKTAATLSNDPESLETLLSNPTVKASFDRNRMLIDLNASPDDLQMHVDSKFTVNQRPL